MYVNSRYTLRHIADIFNTNHHKVKRILVSNGIEITRRNTLKERTAEHCKKLSESCKGRSCWAKGKKMSTDHCLKNLIGHLKFGISYDDLKIYDDFEKLKFLTRGLSRNLSNIIDEKAYLAYIDKFYNDEQFNVIYLKWIQNDKDKWWRPSLDHKTPKSQKGQFDLTNLQFLTWFENRAKAEMTQEEWDKFKRINGTKSNLFIEEIMNV
jgi:hypothetical protein